MTAAMFPMIARSCGICREEGYDEVGEREDGCRASRLDTETGLAPVSSLGVVPVCLMSVSYTSLFLLRLLSSPVSLATIGENAYVAGSTYLIVLPVLRRIH